MSTNAINGLFVDLEHSDAIRWFGLCSSEHSEEQKKPLSSGSESAHKKMAG